MIAPSTNFDLAVTQPTKAPAIVTKAVSFVTQPTPQQSTIEQKQQSTPQPTQPPKQQPTQQPTIEQKQQPVQVDNTTTEL